MDPGTAPNAKAKAKALPRTLEDILNEFGAPDQVQFDPFLPEAPVGTYGQCQTRIGDYVSTEISPWGQFYGGRMRISCMNSSSEDRSH